MAFRQIGLLGCHFYFYILFQLKYEPHGFAQRLRKLQAWNDRQRDLSGAEKDLRAVACVHAGQYRKAEGSS